LIVRRWAALSKKATRPIVFGEQALSQLILINLGEIGGPNVFGKFRTVLCKLQQIPTKFGVGQDS
jgi:hypothetical protein